MHSLQRWGHVVITDCMTTPHHQPAMTGWRIFSKCFLLRPRLRKNVTWISQQCSTVKFCNEQYIVYKAFSPLISTAMFMWLLKLFQNNENSIIYLSPSLMLVILEIRLQLKSPIRYILEWEKHLYKSRRNMKVLINLNYCILLQFVAVILPACKMESHPHHPQWPPAVYISNGERQLVSSWLKH